MKEGYKRWESSKHMILEWLENSENLSSPSSSTKVICRARTFWGRICNWLKGAGCEWETKSCKFFGIIPLCEIKKMCADKDACEGSRIRICILGFPVYECKIEDKRSYWGIDK
jgi:hypothetical protein